MQDAIDCVMWVLKGLAVANDIMNKGDHIIPIAIAQAVL